MAQHEELSKKLEQLAKFYIAADSGDRETISVIAGRLEEISGLAAAASFHACADAAAKAAALFGLSAREAAGGAEAVFSVAGKTISAIQMVVDENRPEADSDFPVELGIIIPEQAETEAIEKIYNALYEFSMITKKSTKDGIYNLVISSSRILNRILSRRIKDNNLVPYVLGAIISVVDELQNDANGNGKNGKYENEMPPEQTAEAEEKALARAKGVKPSPNRGGSIAFEVKSVDAAVKKLRAAKARVLVPAFDTPVCRMAILKDSEGNAFCVHAKKR